MNESNSKQPSNKSFKQLTLFDPPSPAEEWESQATKHALDELFNATYAYRSSKEFNELIRFVRRFHYYSPYNAFLIHIQRPGARFVAPPHRWVRDYGRHVMPNANPIVILQPKRNNELGSPPKREMPKSMVVIEGFVQSKIR